MGAHKAGDILRTNPELAGRCILNKKGINFYPWQADAKNISLLLSSLPCINKSFRADIVKQDTRFVLEKTKPKGKV